MAENPGIFGGCYTRGLGMVILPGERVNIGGKYLVVVDIKLIGRK